MLSQSSVSLSSAGRETPLTVQKHIYLIFSGQFAKPVCFSLLCPPRHSSVYMERPHSDASTVAPIGHHGPLGGAALEERQKRPRNAGNAPVADAGEHDAAPPPDDDDSADSEFEKEEVAADRAYLQEAEEEARLALLERELADAAAVDAFRNRVLSRVARPASTDGDGDDQKDGPLSLTDALERDRDDPGQSPAALVPAPDPRRVAPSNPVLPAALARRTANANAQGKAEAIRARTKVPRVRVRVTSAASSVEEQAGGVAGGLEMAAGAAPSSIRSRAAKPILGRQQQPVASTAEKGSATVSAASNAARPAATKPAKRIGATPSLAGSVPAAKRRRTQETAPISLVDY
jgi:hypothetical protein